MDETTFYFGDWQVEPKSNRLRAGDTVKQLEPKAMDVLKLLCQHDGEVLSSDEIVSHCWPDFDVGDNPLHKIINQLRRALGDSASSPTYIETIRKRGYRTLAPIKYLLGDQQGAATNTWQGASPFPGLQAYTPEHATVFFGRKAQVDTLLDRIANQVHFGRGFCLVLGPSGSGKSSLVQAGVLPNLMTPQGYNGIKVNGYTSLDLADVGPNQLMLELASALLDWEINDVPVFYGESAEDIASKLAEQPQYIIRRCKTVLQEQADHLSMFALFIDRLEVLLSSPLYSDEQRSQFVELIERFATSGVILVLSACRNDFYPQLVAYPPLMAGKAKGAHFDLSPPSRNELLQMIRLPAQAAQLTWQVDPQTGISLDELLCDEAASGLDVLPMLQYTLQALYLNRDDDNQLLVSVYHELGGIEGAIGKNAEQAIALLSQAQRDSLPKVLSQLVTLQHDDASITSRSGRWSLLTSDAEQALVQAMVDSRLFVSHLQNEVACFSIAHEALLRRWPRATEWIAAHKDSLSVKSRLQYLAKRWQEENKNKAYLLPAGKPLQEAQALASSELFSVSSSEVEFIQASNQRANVKTWTLRTTVLVLIMLTVTSVLMTVKSIDAENRALEKRLAAENLLGFMVGDFADKLRGIGRMDLLDGISNKALEYFSEQSNTSDASFYSFDARFQHGQTLEAMGEVAYSRGKIDEATAALLSAKSKLEALLIEQSQNLELLKTLGANAFWLGQIEYDASDWQATQPFFELYYQYSQQMYQIAPDDADALMELSYATNSLGSLLMKRQEFKQAKGYFEESLELKLLVLSKSPNDPMLIADVADTRSWLASVARSQGDIDLAISIHMNLQTEYLNFDKTIQANGYLADRYMGSFKILSDLKGYRGEYDDAFEIAMQGLKVVRGAITLDFDNEHWKIEEVLLNLQLIYIDVVRKNNTYGLKLIDMKPIFESINMLPSDSPRRESLMAAYYLVEAKLFNAKKKSDDALVSANEAVDRYEKLTSFHTKDNFFKAKLAESYVALASSKALMGVHYKDDCIVAEKIIKPLINDKDPLNVFVYGKALSCTGILVGNEVVKIIIQKSGIVGYEF
ncbi:AAA family ATPase [Shewanella sp. Scap07]|uniref:nSTAND1 domain-containing NTPase n=1 Tax=Shewanella sp. Scap07 TaxID=2589987 RepID=UPI0015BFEA95|nr:winged helix-turn-helix domain-containing protein [Shewanella sp. Scap07]QLE85262.1 AAA family ATPase [Shewanella sp. Scap07]